MKLVNFIRYNKQKAASYSIAVHLFLTILISFNFDMTVNERPPQRLIFMEIVNAPEAEVGQIAKVEEALPGGSADPSPASDVPTAAVAQSAAANSADGLTQEEGQTRQGGDPLSEKILWICGVATPVPQEREGFSGAWSRKCTVPPEAFFKEWEITRVIIMGAIIGEGVVSYNGDSFERTQTNADCEKGSFDNRSVYPSYGSTYEFNIPRCQMDGCQKSKCWAMITYYGKTREGKEDPPFLSAWKKSVQPSGGPVYLIDPGTESQRKIASISAVSSVANLSCSEIRGNPNQCSDLNLPPGSSFRGRIEGTKCEDFGAYTSFEECNENHKPNGCDGRQMGNEGKKMLCFRGNGAPNDRDKSPAFILWRKLGLSK